jgi:hypothetical protein
MTNSIDQALVTQFSDMVHIQAEQKRSRLRGLIGEKPVRGNDASIERLDTDGIANEITARHADTILSDVSHTRRQIKMRDFEYTIGLDRFDELQVLIDPAAEYAGAVARKMMRTYDYLAIEAALGSVKTGKNFGTSVTAANDGVTTISAGGVGLTYDKLLEVKENFINNEVGVDEDEDILLLVTGKQHSDMMKEVELTSGDFRREAVVENGRIVSALGMRVITFGTSAASNFLSVSSSIRDCIAMSTRGVVVGINQDITIDVDRRPDKNNMQQVQARFFLGATRREGKLIQKVQCSEA